VAQDPVEHGDPFVVAILTQTQELWSCPTWAGAPLPTNNRPLEWLYPTCAVQGCNNRARLERDHEIDWANS
jgi:hypothetical protein